ncbi:hypothetical protein [Falsiroseomonas sp. E2-1-a20]|uniref:hypothetical protein n=1 Tax=Falsiroseomonas sp. E2-1-a20 TaxID=3239300 RepID=UPI003F2FDA0C
MASGTRRLLSGSAVWLLAVAAEILAGGVLVWWAGQQGPALVAVLVNLAVALRFALTLRPGQVPLITRYARCDVAGLPQHGEGYTRALTAFWGWVLAGFALLHALAMLGWWTTAALSLWQSVACLALFLGEHALRSRRLPELGRATPWRTCRAVLAYHAA